MFPDILVYNIYVDPTEGPNNIGARPHVVWKMVLLHNRQKFMIHITKWNNTEDNWMLYVTCWFNWKQNKLWKKNVVMYTAMLIK